MELNWIIAHNLKRLREERRLSLDKTADITGVSKSMLGQIERGESNPTVTTIKKISTGLKVSVTSLISPPGSEAIVVRGAEIEPLVEEEVGYRVYPVFPFEDGRDFEIYSAEFDPGCLIHAVAHSEKTEEFVTVFEGEMTVLINENRYTAGKGDSIRFRADKPHVYQNTGIGMAYVSMILYYRGE